MSSHLSYSFGTRAIKVVIVDGHARTRSSLRRIIESSGEFQCAGAFATGEEAILKVVMVGAELALMDIQTRGLPGIECMRRMKALQPKLMIVLVTGLTDRQTMARALSAGADGYLAKPFSHAQCLTTLRFVISRRSNLSTRLTGKWAGSAIAVTNGRRQLTARENQVMDGLAKGLLYKEIADELGISFSAVHKHQHKIFNKLRVSNRTEAISKWCDQQRA